MLSLEDFKEQIIQAIISSSALNYFLKDIEVYYSYSYLNPLVKFLLTSTIYN